MPKADSIRAEIHRLIRMRPFQKFVIILENGDRAVIEHPENVAFDPELGRSDDFYVIAGNVRLFSTFGAVTGVALTDRGGAAA